MKEKSLSLQEEAIKILKNELKVDLGLKSFNGDVTTRSLISEKDEREFFVIPRQQIVVCGLDFIPGFISSVTKKIHFNKNVKDGDLINKNQIILSKYEFKNGCNTHPHNFYLQFTKIN